MTMKLMLIGVKKVEFKDGGVKYKNIFLSERNKAYLGWSDTDELANQVVDSDTYDETRAHSRAVEMDARDDKVTYKVIL